MDLQQSKIWKWWHLVSLNFSNDTWIFPRSSFISRFFLFSYRDKEKSEEERKKREMEAMLEQQRLEEEARSKKGGKKKGGLDSAKLVSHLPLSPPPIIVWFTYWDKIPALIDHA